VTTVPTVRPLLHFSLLPGRVGEPMHTLIAVDEEAIERLSRNR